MKTLNAAVEAFAGAIESAHGVMKNRIVNPRGAYCRAVLPLKGEVQRLDVLHHGAALRMHPRRLEVVPYIFRQVCTNGALWAHSGAAFALPLEDHTTETEVEEFVASSTATAVSAETFQTCLEEVRTGLHVRTSIKLNLLSFVKQLGSEFEEHVLEVLLQEIVNHPEASTRYDAMNIVTAAARTVADPEVKWRMESLAPRLLLGAYAGKKKLPSVRARELAEV